MRCLNFTKVTFDMTIAFLFLFNINHYFDFYLFPKIPFRGLGLLDYFNY